MLRQGFAVEDTGDMRDVAFVMSEGANNRRISAEQALAALAQSQPQMCC